jgi:Tol biopolymer transport system component
MNRRICLRCDWEGETKGSGCPSCGGRSLYVVGTSPSGATAISSKDRTDTSSREPTSVTPVAPPGMVTLHEPVPYAPAVEPTRISRRSSWGYGVLALVVAIIVGAFVLMSGTGIDGMPADAGTTPPGVGSPILVEQDPTIVDLEGHPLGQVPGLPGDAHSLSLSADRSRIAFTTSRAGPLTGWVIATIETDGSGLRRLGSEGIFGDSPAWSPEGAKIAFIGIADGGPGMSHEIYLMRADGSNVRSITSGQGSAEGPQWSPDGTTIVYYRRSDRGAGIWAVSPTTGVSTRLTAEAGGPGTFYSYDLTYSPDGSQIAYSREGEIWLMDTDGADPRRILDDVPGFSPRWSPDGTTLAYTTLADPRLPDVVGGPQLRVNVIEIATGEHHTVGDVLVSSVNPPVWWSNDELLVRPVAPL